MENTSVLNDIRLGMKILARSNGLQTSKKRSSIRNVIQLRLKKELEHLSFKDGCNHSLKLNCAYVKRATLSPSSYSCLLAGERQAQKRSGNGFANQ